MPIQLLGSQKRPCLLRKAFLLKKTNAQIYANIFAIFPKNDTASDSPPVLTSGPTLAAGLAVVGVAVVAVPVGLGVVLEVADEDFDLVLLVLLVLLLLLEVLGVEVPVVVPVLLALPVLLAVGILGLGWIPLPGIWLLSESPITTLSPARGSKLCPLVARIYNTAQTII